MGDELPQTARLGVVEFLNARPLIDGLEERDGIELYPAVPALLADMLAAGRVDAALVPVIDLARAGDTWQRISDAGIASDGQTLTVRVFSRVRPDQMTTLHLDTDSHTSVVLAQLIWRHFFNRPIEPRPLPRDGLSACESVLLIGDKVVTAPAAPLPYTIDLGRAWKQWTGLPFVFAVWAAPAGRPSNAALGRLLSEVRDRGVARAARLAAEFGPAHGWPPELAEHYLTRCMRYTITPAAEEGMARFIAMARAEGFITEDRKVTS